jgi:hypothetical protein
VDRKIKVAVVAAVTVAAASVSALPSLGAHAHTRGVSIVSGAATAPPNDLRWD